MELDHLHVAQREPGPIRERDAVGGLVGRARDDLVHRRPPAHREQGRSSVHDEKTSGADVQHQRARAARRTVQQELDGAALLERPDVVAPHHLLGQPIHDLDAGQVTLVDRPIVRLAGEWLLMDAPFSRAIEEAAVARLELEHPARRFRHERPHELLIVDPAAADERVEEVGVERIGLGEHRVVAALHHARTAGAPQQALDDHGDREIRRAVGGVERGAEPGAARAEDQDVGLDAVDHSGAILARPWQPRRPARSVLANPEFRATM